jgi:hypothetical protein
VASGIESHCERLVGSVPRARESGTGTGLETAISRVAEGWPCGARGSDRHGRGESHARETGRGRASGHAMENARRCGPVPVETCNAAGAECDGHSPTDISDSHKLSFMYLPQDSVLQIR